MIIGIGTDLCDAQRIRLALTQHGPAFAQRLLCPGEYATWEQRSSTNAQRGERFLATRFAAKEAFGKALATGIRAPMTWHNCEVSNDAIGAPFFVLHGELAAWFATKGWRSHVSLSDEGDMTAAFVVIESAPDAGATTAPITSRVG